MNGRLGGTRLHTLEPRTVSINWSAWYLLAYDYLRNELPASLNRFESARSEGADVLARQQDIAMAVQSHDGHVLAQHM